MQSFTTQSHQRNYQGKIIFPVVSRNNDPRLKHHKIINGLALSMMVLAVAVVGSLFGVSTLHNLQLKHRIQTLEAQKSIYVEEHCGGATPCLADYETTTVTSDNTEHTKELQRIPISKKHHHTQPMPTINNRHN